MVRFKRDIRRERLRNFKNGGTRVTYGREEGGFAVYHNGKKVCIWRVKGWMNGLREWPGISHSGAPDRFMQAQKDYNGFWI